MCEGTAEQYIGAIITTIRTQKLNRCADKQLVRRRPAESLSRRKRAPAASAEFSVRFVFEVLSSKIILEKEFAVVGVGGYRLQQVAPAWPSHIDVGRRVCVVCDSDAALPTDRLVSWPGTVQTPLLATLLPADTAANRLAHNLFVYTHKTLLRSFYSHLFRNNCLTLLRSSHF